MIRIPTLSFLFQKSRKKTLSNSWEDWASKFGVGKAMGLLQVLSPVSSGKMVINGESDFESLGFTDGYEADYTSVQCVGPP